MILCSGAFDGLHAGHVRYLSAAVKLAQEGEDVVVLVAPDSYLTAEKKRVPRWVQQDRWRTLQSVRDVRALPQADISVAPNILGLKPRLFVKGVDWAGKLPEDVREACRTTGTQIVFVDTDGTHTRDAFQDR